MGKIFGLKLRQKGTAAEIGKQLQFAQPQGWARPAKMSLGWTCFATDRILEQDLQYLHCPRANHLRWQAGIATSPPGVSTK